jgi:hypothetical protein
MGKAGFLRTIFALSFLFSAYTKFIAPGYFEITLMDQGLASTRNFAGHISRFFIGLEFALGVALIFPFYTRKLLLFSQFLLLGFTLHLIYLWSIGNTENCGCFGEMISMTPEESIVKNSALMLLAFWVYIKSSIDKHNPRLLLCTLLIPSMWFFLPMPDHASMSFSQYTHFEKVGRVDLSQGEQLVAVFNLDCEHCQDAAKELAALQRKNKATPSIYVLFFSEGSTLPKDFDALTNSDFPYQMIGVNTFFDLIGDSPPRLYHLSNGTVVNIWDKAILKAVKDRFELD